ncbi:MAG: septum formation initiator family protein [Verrucomicrobiae bacterium]|nr:septum formation initiator family protein [Verrucomicrobiae bacterium]MCX7723127.1 septum formation initiator family protein [Verrucomicrobiae bacterium]MDW7979298.1 septum formation initiator family protein [Verrucomicrobiales bacterium]
MKPDLGIWDKLNRAAVLLLVLAAVMGVVVLFTPLFRQKERLHKELIRLDGQIEKAQQENKQLEAAVKILSRDPKAVERVAREKLGYAKPGETIIRFVPGTNAPTQP